MCTKTIIGPESEQITAMTAIILKFSDNYLSVSSHTIKIYSLGPFLCWYVRRDWILSWNEIVCSQDVKHWKRRYQWGRHTTLSQCSIHVGHECKRHTCSCHEWISRIPQKRHTFKQCRSTIVCAENSSLAVQTEENLFCPGFHGITRIKRNVGIPNTEHTYASVK